MFRDRPDSGDLLVFADRCDVVFPRFLADGEDV